MVILFHTIFKSFLYLHDFIWHKIFKVIYLTRLYNLKLMKIYLVLIKDMYGFKPRFVFLLNGYLWTIMLAKKGGRRREECEIKASIQLRGGYRNKSWALSRLRNWYRIFRILDLHTYYILIRVTYCSYMQFRLILLL